MPFSQEYLDMCARKLGEMVRIPSVSRAEHEDLTEFYRLHRLLEEQFPRIHEKLQRTELRGSLLYRWESGSELEPILLMGHLDVVPADREGWSVEPFSGAVKEGCLYGRGALDCKSTVFTELQAIEELLEEGYVPSRDIYLAFSINEETGGDGAAAIVRHLKERGVRLAMALDEGGAVIDKAVEGMDRPYAVIGLTEKGYMDVKITARGKGGHSSTPPRKTPAARLFAFAAEIERKRPFRKKLLPVAEAMLTAMGPSFPRPLRFFLKHAGSWKPLLVAVMPKVSPFGEALLSTTCCFTMMQGSSAANVIPKEPYLVANLRTSVHQNCGESLAVLQKYADKYDLELTVLLRRDASPVSDLEGIPYKLLEELVREHFPEAGVAPYMIMGGTDCRHFHALTDSALRFAPVRMTAEQSASCHAVDENVTVTSLAEAVAFYKDMIRKFPA